MKVSQNLKSLVIVFNVLAAIVGGLVFYSVLGEAAPLGFRLPFVSPEYIIAGPGCIDTHTGANAEAIDYNLQERTSVFATFGGTVIFAGENAAWPGRGIYIEIEHPDLKVSRYLHLTETLAVTVTEWVEKGEYIAPSGSTGQGVTGPHLHFQVNESDGTPVPIRDLFYTEWWSGDPNNPCVWSGETNGIANGPQVTGRLLVYGHPVFTQTNNPMGRLFGPPGEAIVNADDEGYLSFFNVPTSQYVIQGNYYFTSTEVTGFPVCPNANQWSFVLLATNTVWINEASATTMADKILGSGNANGDSQVNIADFGILAGSYLKTCADPTFEPRADFNENCQVEISDFGILSAHYLQLCPDTAPWAVLVSQGTPVGGAGAGAPLAAPEKAVSLTLVSVPPRVKTGEVFPLTIALLNPARQPIHGAEVHLAFDPRYLEVVDAAGKATTTVAAGDALPLILYNQADNKEGRITFAAGAALGTTWSHEKTTLATIYLKAKATTASTVISFSTAPRQKSDVVFGGSSVLKESRDAALKIE
ncbi:MAG: peptidoglycan DD-metalloendopeptidase family protein [Chloroflexi bacterium]|nr:peptidoglycan DD-metalloendopeptidase family protein [Chloroflexota bacterium]